jgi:DNA-binding MarR family transcriptional regulator
MSTIGAAMPSRPVSDLTSHLGYWLRFVSNHVSGAFARKLADRDVSVAEWVLLRELYGAEALAPSHLAEAIGMTRGAITKLADKLIAKRLIRREADTADGRAQTLALTPKGRALIPDLATLADQNDAEFFGDLDPALVETVKSAMKDVIRRRGLKSIPTE